MTFVRAFAYVLLWMSATSAAVLINSWLAVNVARLMGWV